MKFGSYTIVRSDIAKGGSGVIHEASDAAGRRVAIKVLAKDRIIEDIRSQLTAEGMALDDIERRAPELYLRNVEQFKNEFSKLVGLQHPNVGEALDFGFTDGHYYMVTEFIDGDEIAKFCRGKTIKEMLPLFVQALDGLDFIHRNGFVHLDIKSENILVGRDKNGAPVVKIIDFGLARLPSAFSGEFCGSPSYIAPEVALGQREKVDARADLFSFGVVMYFCVTWGQFPFARHGLKDGHKAVSVKIQNEKQPKPPSFYMKWKGEDFIGNNVDRIIMRLLGREPKDRFYSNARAVMNALLTQEPDAFRDDTFARGAYLVPEGGRHIGREDIQSRINVLIQDALLPNGRSEHIHIHGAHGMGKTHLLRTLRNHYSKFAASMDIMNASLPMTEEEWKDKQNEFQDHFSEAKKTNIIIFDDINEAIDNEQIKYISNLTNALKSTSSSLASRTILITSSCDPIDHAKNFELLPFDPKEIKDYFSSTPAFKEIRMPPSFIDTVLNRTSGIPLEIVDLLEIMDTRGLFDLEGNVRFELPSTKIDDTGNIAVSTAARLVLKYRGLPTAERELMDWLSVWCTLDISDAPEMLDMCSVSGIKFIVSAVANLHSSGLVGLKPLRASDKRITKLIYDKLDGAVRLRMHAAIADCMSKGSGCRAKDSYLFHRGSSKTGSERIKDILQLSYRLERSGRPIKVAIKVLEHFYKEAISLYSDLSILYLSLLVRLYSKVGRYTNAAELYELSSNSVEFKEAPWPVRARLLINFVPVLLQERKLEVAMDLIGSALPQVSPRSASYLMLRNYIARIHYLRAHTKNVNVTEDLSAAQKIYEETSSSALSECARQRTYNNELPLVLLAQGEFAKAIELLEQRMRRNALSSVTMSKTLITLADAYWSIGDIRNAERYSIEAIGKAKDAHDLHMLIYADLENATITFAANKFSDTLRAARDAETGSLVLTNGNESNDVLTRSWLYAGHARMKLGDVLRARLNFEAVVENNGGINIFTLMWAHLGLGELDAAQGNYDRMTTHFDIAEKILNELPAKTSTPYKIDILLSKYRIAKKSNDSSAEEFLRQMKVLTAASPDLVKKLETELKDI